MARSEARAARAIAALPDGRYENESWSDGFESRSASRSRDHRRRRADIDFAGSSPQSSRGINVVLNYPHAYATFAIKAAIAPDVPHNEGSFRPVHVTAPRGLDPQLPSSRRAVASGT